MRIVCPDLTERLFQKVEKLGQMQKTATGGIYFASFSFSSLFFILHLSVLLVTGRAWIFLLTSEALNSTAQIWRLLMELTCRGIVPT